LAYILTSSCFFSLQYILSTLWFIFFIILNHTFLGSNYNDRREYSTWYVYGLHTDHCTFSYNKVQAVSVMWGRTLSCTRVVHCINCVTASCGAGQYTYSCSLFVQPFITSLQCHVKPC
jgi:hypothetical protein